MSVALEQPMRRDDTPGDADSASPDETLGDGHDAHDAHEDSLQHGTPPPPPKRKGGRKPVCPLLLKTVDLCVNPCHG